jgi:chitinase
LRDRFNQEQTILHRRLYLSVAAGSNQDFLDHTDMRAVQRYVDAVDVMAYDYYEPGSEPTTGHNAPLFANPADPNHDSADETVRAFEQAGVPARKIVLGVPFYGHEWGHVSPQHHGLFQPGKPVPGAFATYGNIIANMLNASGPDKGFVRYWDAASKVPYLYNANAQIFVSYDDPESMALKCRYVLQHHLAGVMFWDYESDSSGALLDVVDATLLHDKSIASQANVAPAHHN